MMLELTENGSVIFDYRTNKYPFRVNGAQLLPIGA